MVTITGKGGNPSYSSKKTFLHPKLEPNSCDLFSRFRPQKPTPPKKPNCLWLLLVLALPGWCEPPENLVATLCWDHLVSGKWSSRKLKWLLITHDQHSPATKSCIWPEFLPQNLTIRSGGSGLSQKVLLSHVHGHLGISGKRATGQRWNGWRRITNDWWLRMMNMNQFMVNRKKAQYEWGWLDPPEVSDYKMLHFHHEGAFRILCEWDLKHPQTSKCLKWREDSSC